MTTTPAPSTALQRAGGLAALYIVLADLAAIAYFVLLVDYPATTEPAAKVALLTENHTSLYLMHLVCFELVALALIVLTIATYQRLTRRAHSLAQLAGAVGLIHAGLLLASVQTYNVGMNAVVELQATAPQQAISAWAAIEPIAEGLAGSDGQIVAGVWVLLLSAAALRAKEFPRALNWLGAGIGTLGILAAIPALDTLDIVFGLLQIVWFAWLGISMLRTSADSPGSTRIAYESGVGVKSGIVVVNADGSNEATRFH